MRFLFKFILLLCFASVQSLAAVCEAKCSFGENLSFSSDSPNEAHDCHSTMDDEDTNTENSDNNCGQLCQSGDVIAELSFSFVSIEKVSEQIHLFESFDVPVLSRIKSFDILNHDPPNFGFYSSTSIFIQKESYLI